MIILNKGRLLWAGKKIRCKSCGTTLILTPEDNRKVVDMFGEYYFIGCPTCAENIRFKIDIKTRFLDFISFYAKNYE